MAKSLLSIPHARRAFHMLLSALSMRSIWHRIAMLYNAQCNAQCDMECAMRYGMRNAMVMVMVIVMRMRCVMHHYLPPCNSHAMAMRIATMRWPGFVRAYNFNADSITHVFELLMLI